MSGPWERYANQAPSPDAAGPWTRYGAAQPQPSRAQRVAEGAVRTGGLGAQEMVRGLSNLLGFPADVVNMSPMLLNLLPGEQGMTPISDRPVGGAEFLYDTLQRAPADFIIENVENPVREAVGAEPAPTGDIEAQNWLERIYARTMQEVGAAAVPMAGMLAAAPRVGVQGARQMGGPVGDILERAALAPGQTTATETFYAGAAGAGAGGARELVSDGDPNTETSAETWADLIGALLGAGTAGVTRYAATGVNDAAGAALGTSGYTSRIVRDTVTDELIRASGDNTPVPTGDALISEISGGPRIGETVPGFNETLADRTGNPGIANLEYGRQSGPNAGLFTARRMENAGATQGAINAQRPDATPGAFSDNLTRATEDYVARVSREAEEAGRAADAAAEPLAPAMGGEDRGQVVRGALDEALESAREAERTAWSSVGGEADAGGLGDATAGVTARLTEARRSAYASDVEEIDRIAATLSERGTVPLAEVTDLRSLLTTRLREAQNAGDRNRANVLEGYISAVDDYLNTAAPGQAEALDAARAVSRELNDRFTRPGDPVAGAVRRGEGGVPRLPDSRVAPSFVQPDEGQSSNLARLLTETNNDPAVREALRDQILADVRARNLLGDEQRLNQYLERYADAFEMFPDLRQELGSAASLRMQADGLAQNADQELRRLTAGGPSTVGRYLSYGDERAADAMSSVVNSRDPAAAADELLSMVDGNAEAVEGARAAFWQLMERKTRSSGSSTRGADGSQPWRPESLHNFLNDPATAAVAERLYRDNPEHLQNIREIAEATRMAGTASTARAPNSSGTPQALQGSRILPSTETIGSRAFAVQRGVVSPGFAGFNIAAIIARRAVLRGNQEAYQKLMDQALLNPELARLLVQENNPANRAALARGARLWLGSTVGELTDLIEDGLEEDASGTGDETLDAALAEPGPMRMTLTDPGNQRRDAQ